MNKKQAALKIAKQAIALQLHEVITEESHRMPRGIFSGSKAKVTTIDEIAESILRASGVLTARQDIEQTAELRRWLLKNYREGKIDSLSDAEAIKNQLIAYDAIH